MTITRRGFLAAGAAAYAAANLPVFARAQEGVRQLAAATRTIDIRGKAATVFGLGGEAGQGLILDPGERFRVDLRNDLAEPTLIHWHGQIPPNEQDGVPGIPMPMLEPGESRSYDFEPLPGTYWMHSHVPFQEMQLLAAPLIVRSADDERADRQEVTLFLHDFAFKSPQEIMSEIAGGHDAGAPMGGMDHTAMERDSMAGMSTMPGMGAMGDMGMMGDMAMDLNDYDWDAYLANDRTLADPEVVRVDKGGRVRLRVINAASATVFWIDTGAAAARLVAVDGHPAKPVGGTRFGLAMGQRLDLELDLPQGEGAWPILALREGARERTGIVLATPGAEIGRIAELADVEAPAFDIDLSQEAALEALEPLSAKPTDASRMLMLGGTMTPYVWTIDDAVWGQHRPIRARSGERVLLGFHNMSMMGHPMHLHGHVFQVVEINGRPVSGARRDTVYVPPMSMITVALDAGEAARWMLHCHHMPHLETGMMTEFEVTA
ncbi:MAG: copper oxidase [Pelagibacterium sp. SCN 63-23]|nr:MAG: copper oxidase [Pelagibacterium sp. SCN 63-23]